MKLNLEDVKITGYDPIRGLGEGFFSEVWLVKNRASGYERAVKIITDDAFIQRLREEAEVTERLKHPNIVEVYDVITEVERPYILMEYVKGQDLKQRLRQAKKLGEGEIRRIAEQMIKGMIQVHRQGIIHCDIKPANILLGQNENVKISDFNLGMIVTDVGREIASRSKFEPAEGSLPWGEDFSEYPADQRTISFLRGTWAYMAPEVQKGGQPTKLSDQYSMGLVIEEMLAHG